jgi:rhodanese-related sulfurtransferase
MFLPRLVRQFKAGLMITPEMLRALQAEGGIAVIDVREAKDFDWRDRPRARRRQPAAGRTAGARR